MSLHDLLVAGRGADVNAAAVEANVGHALDTLHALDLVHCDIALNNVLLVGGVWKLGDLDGCRPRGEPLDRFQPDRYRHPHAQPGSPAEPEFDLYGLDRIHERLSEG